MNSKETVVVLFRVVKRMEETARLEKPEKEFTTIRNGKKFVTKEMNGLDELLISRRR
jgi:hypothetical protein